MEKEFIPDMVVTCVLWVKTIQELYLIFDC